jgi:hypothetical protein
LSGDGFADPSLTAPFRVNPLATKERAEMKMIEFFIARKIVVDGAGHSITKRREL